MKRALVIALLAAGCGIPEGPVGQREQPRQPDPIEQQGPLTGLPCDVKAVLETNCASCHAAAVYIRGFTSRADFLADWGEGKTLGAIAVEKLSDAEQPMPPRAVEKQPTVEERAVLVRWVEAGMPGGACGELARR